MILRKNQFEAISNLELALQLVGLGSSTFLMLETLFYDQENTLHL